MLPDYTTNQQGQKLSKSGIFQLTHNNEDFDTSRDKRQSFVENWLQIQIYIISQKYKKLL